MQRYEYATLAAAALLAGLVGSKAIAQSATPPGADDPITRQEADRKAPLDYGFGPGVQPPVARALNRAASASIPNGGPNAATGGIFGVPVTWPIIPIHVVLLPDGRVMNYGTNQLGLQGAQLVYDVWDPGAGTGSDAHLVLPNGTATDIFCGEQSLMWTTGKVLLGGGDLTINGKRNFSNNTTNIFDPQGNTLTANGTMQFARWYASLVALPNGEMLALGGRQGPGAPATTPEVFNPTAGWRTLTGATSTAAYGTAAQNWFYPRAWVGPTGSVFLLTADGHMFTLDPTGTGTLTRLTHNTVLGRNMLPTLMFAPGKLLSVREQSQVVVVDLNRKVPLATPTASIDQERLWASGTVLPDGRVLVTGGSLVANQLTGVAYNAEIWDPATGQWTAGASATKPRLYHSNSLLLPDGSVLTGGGGAPGPVKNLNAEIYYPPYLYLSDGSGNPAPRPSLLAAPATVMIGQTITATVGDGDQISRVTFVRTGSSTHSTNLDQRFLDLPFTQSGEQLTITPPKNANTLLPGYYMLFAFQNGVPSVARIVLVQNRM